MWPSRSLGSASRLAGTANCSAPRVGLATRLLLHTSLPSTGGHQGTQPGGTRWLAWGPASTPGGGGLPRGLGGALRLWEELGSQGTTSVHKPRLWFQVLSLPSHKERNVGVVKAGGSPGNARTRRRVQHTARQAEANRKPWLLPRFSSQARLLQRKAATGHPGTLTPTPSQPGLVGDTARPGRDISRAASHTEGAFNQGRRGPGFLSCWQKPDAVV